jgi:hypothetical protein
VRTTGVERPILSGRFSAIQHYGIELGGLSAR